MAPSSGKTRVLVVEDDLNFQKAVADYLADLGYEVCTAGTGAAALEACARRRMDVVLLDQKLPDALGVELCPRILSRCEQAKILFVTAYPSFDNAVGAIKAGAFDYLCKPIELEELDHSVARAARTAELEAIEQLQSYRSLKERERATLIGVSPAFEEVRRLVGLAADSQANVLVTGETGTGKNVVAKAIHYSGPKRQAPFISINCAAIPSEMIESELFGHEKGAFTGAAASRKGIFEMAHGGTLFLDEIGAMPLGLQSKLLTVLEDKHVRRVGGQSTIEVDTRIIAATNAEPEKAIEQGELRADLFYRLNVIRIHLPPLRARPEDIGPLSRHFLATMAMGKPVRIPDSEIRRLEAYGWPGNARELRNVIERALTIQPGPDLQPSLLLQQSATAAAEATIHAEEKLLELAEVEKRHILGALDRLGGNLTKTAIQLGISESTLRRKLKAYRRL